MKTACDTVTAWIEAPRAMRGREEWALVLTCALSRTDAVRPVAESLRKAGWWEDCRLGWTPPPPGLVESRFHPPRGSALFGTHTREEMLADLSRMKDALAAHGIHHIGTRHYRSQD